LGREGLDRGPLACRGCPCRVGGGICANGPDVDLGDYETAVPGSWAPGDLLYDGGKAAWRITAVLELDSVYEGLWEVEPITG
jgi:hypothetical protein